MYEDRIYRKEMGKDLDNFLIVLEETDLWIGLSKGYIKDSLKKDLKKHIIKNREILKKHITIDPKFNLSLVPYKVSDDSPDFIKEMSDLSFATEAGPMAGVAGAFSLLAGQFLKEKNIPKIIVENGGDIYVYGFDKITTGIYAGSSPFTGRINVEIKLDNKEFGICSSSGSFGHSLSFGKADLVTVISENVVLADLLATDICNKIKSKDDIDRVIDDLKDNEKISGAIIILEDKLGAFGNIEIKGRN